MSCCEKYEALIRQYLNTVSASQFACLMFIASRANGSGGVAIPLTDLMAGTGLARATAVRSVRALEECGAIGVDRSTPANVFTLLTVPAAAQSTAAAVDGSKTELGSSKIEPPNGSKIEPPYNNARPRVSDETRYSYVNKNNQVSDAREAPRRPQQPAFPFSSPKPMPAPKPPADNYEAAQHEAILSTLALFTSIKRPRPANIVERVLAAAHAWGKNGFQAAAELERAYKVVERKPEHRPREWAWCVSVIRNAFRAAVEGDRKLDREEAAAEARARDKVQPIDESALPLKYAAEDYHPEWRDEIRAMLNKTAKAL